MIKNSKESKTDTDLYLCFSLTHKCITLKKELAFSGIASRDILLINMIFQFQVYYLSIQIA